MDMITSDLGFNQDFDPHLDSLGDVYPFANVNNVVDTGFDFNGLFNNTINTPLDFVDHAMSFADMEGANQVEDAACYHYTPAIAPKPFVRQPPGSRFTPIDDVDINTTDINRVGNDHETDILPPRPGQDLSTSWKPKRRRRKDLERLFTEGPNPFGWKGRKKCQRCRFNHVKCEFDEMNPDLPCRRCVSKRYTCGKKTFGPKSQMVEERKQAGVSIGPLSVVHRSLGTPSDQLLLDNDLVYLQFYDYTVRATGLHEPISISGKDFLVYICYPDFDITSIPFRAAILAFATFAMPGERRQSDTRAYYAAYYRAASEAITRKDVASLMYASYVMAIINLVYEEPTCNAMTHCAQFCRTLEPCSERGLSMKERGWIRGLWENIARSAYIRHWLEQYHHRIYEFELRGLDLPNLFEPRHRRRGLLTKYAAALSRSPNLNRLVELIRISAAFTNSGAAESFDPYDQIYINSICVQIYVEHCLFDALYTQEPAASPFTKPLQSLLLQIMTLTEGTDWLYRLDLLDDWLRYYDAISGTSLLDPISDLDLNSRGSLEDSTSTYDIDMTNLYICSRILVKLLFSKLDHEKDDESEVYKSALATVHFLSSSLAHFSSDSGYSAVLRRSLFWAGLILYKRGDRQGKGYIQRILASPLEWPENRKEDFQDEFYGFMEAVERCDTWDNIWNIEVGGVSLVHYALAFVPFFCRSEAGYVYAA